MLLDGNGSFDYSAMPTGFPMLFTPSTCPVPILEPDSASLTGDIFKSRTQSVEVVRDYNASGVSRAESSQKVPREPRSKDWDMLRPIVNALYSTLTLAQVKEMLKNEHGFKVRIQARRQPTRT